VAIAVGILLVGVRIWLREPEVPGNYHPIPGDYRQVSTDQSGQLRIVPVLIEQQGDARATLRMPWARVEPSFEVPSLLRQHAPEIHLLVALDSSGHVVDVTGPDDYLDELDRTDPDAADRLRAMELEEQASAALTWQLASYLPQLKATGSTFSTEARQPGYGERGWTGVIDYTIEEVTFCPEKAPEPKCVRVSYASRPERGGHVEMEGEFLIGAETGMEWQGLLVRRDGLRTRRVARQLLRLEDAPAVPRVIP
jgi:hypothetical protein